MSFSIFDASCLCISVMLEVPHTETHRDGVDIYDNIIPYIKGGGDNLRTYEDSK